MNAGGEDLVDAAELEVGLQASGAPLRVGDRICYQYFCPCGKCRCCTKGTTPRCADGHQYRYEPTRAPHFNAAYGQYYYLRKPQAVYRVPDNVSDDLAGPANCALSQVIDGLERANVRPGDSLVIQGAGGLGLNAVAVARERGVDPIDLLCDLSLTDRLEPRFRMAVVNTDEDEVEELLTHPDTVLGLSDAGAHASQLCDACFSTHLLSRWVREREALTLERAVHMLTARPAEIFGIRDRGLLAEGRPADVVVFDPATVGAGPLQHVGDLPGGADRLVSEAFGIDAVIVNGAILRRNGADALTPEDPLPGRLLRRGHAD